MHNEMAWELPRLLALPSLPEDNLASRIAIYNSRLPENQAFHFAYVLRYNFVPLLVVGHPPERF